MTLECDTCGGSVILEDSKERDDDYIEYYVCPAGHDGTLTLHDDGTETMTGCVTDNGDY